MIYVNAYVKRFYIGTVSLLYQTIQTKTIALGEFPPGELYPSEMPRPISPCKLSPNHSFMYPMWK